MILLFVMIVLLKKDIFLNEKYKLKMKEKYPKFKHLEMKVHGHFIGSFHHALCHTKTEYFMMLQHDIKLVGNLPIEKLLNMRLNWNILATNHMKDGFKKDTLVSNNRKQR